MPILTLLNLLLYAVAGGLCLLAAWRTVRRGLPRAHAAQWLVGATAMAASMAMRWFDLEERVKQALRSELLSDGTYDARWAMQGPLAAVALVLVSALAFLLVRQVLRDTSHSWLVALRVMNLALAGLAGLVAFRFISYHPVDQLLYLGPIHPNWILDGLFTAIVGVSAAHFAFGRPVIRKGTDHG